MTTQRRYRGGDLVVASHNPGKVREIGDLLAGRVAGRVRSAAELDLDEPEETGTTFTENALIKAHAAAAAGHIALADDSGLAVPALGGAPGIHSARWAGPERDFAAAMRRLEDALPAGADRSAYFVCALALVWPDGEEAIFEGRVDGTLVWPPRGDYGFGYDPMFVATGYDITFGEMDPQQKHRTSHRADAFRRLVAACF
ncbi:MAG: RdgB/HAM1 family non-canonical purine NTP pyrophosphatase [Alphaproteobacteria bacterium]|nr:RdgB/HAM1 family non-canonical purine NTP pyrophosphatase [Alphaproteobacteria bacterium]